MGGKHFQIADERFPCVAIETNITCKYYTNPDKALEIENQFFYDDCWYMTRSHITCYGCTTYAELCVMTDKDDANPQPILTASYVGCGLKVLYDLQGNKICYKKNLEFFDAINDESSIGTFVSINGFNDI